MPKVHKSYRLEAETVEKVKAWAEEHGETVTQAVEALLTRATDEERAEREDRQTAEAVADMRRELETLRAQAEAWHDQRAMLGDHITTLKEQTYTLTAQVKEKDRQIARLQDAIDHEQVLQAAHVAGTLQGTTEETEPDAQPRGVWAWLARKIQGR